MVLERGQLGLDGGNTPIDRRKCVVSGEVRRALCDLPSTFRAMDSSMFSWMTVERPWIASGSFASIAVLTFSSIVVGKFPPLRR